MVKKCTSIIIAVCFFVPFLILGQNQDSKREIYTLFDNTVGIDNTGIYNGIEYREKFRALNNNYAYLDSPNFMLSTIEYDGQVYYNINLKYNIYQQNVIVKLKDKNASETVVKLYNNKIRSFTINNRKFINIHSNIDGVSGFYEEAFHDADYSLLIKHQKFKKDLYQNELMYVEFVTAKKEYLIFSNNIYSALDSKKDISKVFPEFKQKTNQFYRDNKSLRKMNYDQFLITLLQEIKLAKLK